MPVVHHAVEAVGPRRRHIPSRVAALACCGALLAGCGGSSDAACADAGAAAQREPDAGRRDGAAGELRALAAAAANSNGETPSLNLRKFAGGPVGSSKVLKVGRVLDDGRAYKVLESWCKNYFARGFKLYKLYERAAAFVGRSPTPGT